MRLLLRPFEWLAAAVLVVCVILLVREEMDDECEL